MWLDVTDMSYMDVLSRGAFSWPGGVVRRLKIAGWWRNAGAIESHSSFVEGNRI